MKKQDYAIYRCGKCLAKYRVNDCIKRDIKCKKCGNKKNNTFYLLIQKEEK